MHQKQSQVQGVQREGDSEGEVGDPARGAGHGVRRRSLDPGVVGALQERVGAFQKLPGSEASR